MFRSWKLEKGKVLQLPVEAKETNNNNNKSFQCMKETVNTGQQQHNRYQDPTQHNTFFLLLRVCVCVCLILTCSLNYLLVQKNQYLIFQPSGRFGWGSFQTAAAAAASPLPLLQRAGAGVSGRVVVSSYFYFHTALCSVFISFALLLWAAGMWWGSTAEIKAPQSLTHVSLFSAPLPPSKHLVWTWGSSHHTSTKAKIKNNNDDQNLFSVKRFEGLLKKEQSVITA